MFAVISVLEKGKRESSLFCAVYQPISLCYQNTESKSVHTYLIYVNISLGLNIFHISSTTRVECKTVGEVGSVIMYTAQYLLDKLDNIFCLHITHCDDVTAGTVLMSNLLVECRKLGTPYFSVDVCLYVCL